MGRCLVLAGLLAVANGGLMSCDGPTAPPPLTFTAPAEGPWTMFVGDEGIGSRRSEHDEPHRLAQFGTSRRLPAERVRSGIPWAASLELRSGRPGEPVRAAHRAAPPRWGPRFEAQEGLTLGDLLGLRRRLELSPRLRDGTPLIGFASEPQLPWHDVAAWWAAVVDAGPQPVSLRICGASAPSPTSWGDVRRSNGATALVVAFPTSSGATGPAIDVVTDDAVTGPFPPVTIRSGGAEFRFPGGDPYATKDNVEAANRSWRALTAALRDPAAGRARPADLAIGSRVPWAHVAQLLATLADVGITRLRMPDRPYGLELRFAGLSGASLDDLAAWDFPRPSPWPWIGAGLALAGLLGVVAWAPWGRARRRRSVSDRATR